MNRIKLTVLFLLVHLGLAQAQLHLNPERKAVSKLRKGKWGAVRKILNKSLLKDQENLEANYVYGLLYFTPQYPNYNVDSASSFYHKAWNQFQRTDSKGKDRLKKFPIDQSVLAEFKKEIDSIAFEKAKSIGTEESYIHFISNYSTSTQLQTAVELRDELAFIDALKQNTHFSFKEFLTKYPKSHRATEATQRYDKLLYEYSTRNSSLEEFLQYINQNPASPFLDQAVTKIFELTTLMGDEESFALFIRKYPGSSSAKRARNFLLHLNISKQQNFILNDSLQTIYPTHDWLPITEDGKWGFMNEAGQVTLPPTLPNVNENYLCSPLDEDFILTSIGIISRNGKTIASGHFNGAIDIGSGYIKATADSTINLIHKSGFTPPIHTLTDASIIGSQFIAGKQGDKWGLYSLTGFPILPFDYDGISNRGRFAIFSKSGRELLIELNKVLSYANGKWEAVVADEIKAFGPKYLWIRNGSLEKILDNSLHDVIPFDRHALSYTPVGLIQKKGGFSYLQDWDSLKDKPIASLKIIEPWLITREMSEKPSLYYIPTQQLVTKAADSIWFDNSFAGVLINDSIRLWQSPDRTFTIPFHEEYSIRRSKDSTVFILIRGKSKTNVHLAASFDKLFASNFHDIQPILSNLFLVKEKDKTGLIDEKGKIILKPEYDAILYSNGVFSLLKDRKFGSYNPSTKKLLKPTFESNLIAYNQDWTIGRKDSKVGFIKSDGTSKINFDFDDINFWSDTLALVKLNGVQALYSINNKKLTLENMDTFQSIEQAKTERLAFFSQNKLLGLIGAVSGIIIKPQFDEITYHIVNNTLIFIGMKLRPEDQAELSYLDLTGKVIRKQLVNEDTAYSILCD